MRRVVPALGSKMGTLMSQVRSRRILDWAAGSKPKGLWASPPGRSRIGPANFPAFVFAITPPST